MNIIFCAVMIAGGAIMCAVSPDGFLTALLRGTEKAASSTLTLGCIYALWTGLTQVADDAGVNAAIAKGLSPICHRLFATKSAEGAHAAALNLSCNIFGLGGAATPFGLKASALFDGEGNVYGRNMLFILNACSVQLVPSTVIALRASAGSASPADVFLPALICTAVCTGAAAVSYALLSRKRKCPKWRR